MPTVIDTLQKGTDYLEKYGVENARLNMQQLISHVLKCDRMQVYVDFDRELDESQLSALRELTKKRAKGEPLQHLLGTIEFCSIEFKTDNRALIPRPETEELTELCSKMDLPKGAAILDLGCGSGVIGLSLAMMLEKLSPQIVLADISQDALNLAQENHASLAPVTSVSWVISDLFENIEGTFDLIVANLPYIPDSEKTSLSVEVLQDPELALYGGSSGTEIITRFFDQVNAFLKPGGRIALEYGIDQEDEIRQLAENKDFDNIQIIRDLCKVNRFLLAVKS